MNTVTYTLTLDDYTAYLLYQVNHGSQALRRGWSARFLPLVLVLCLGVALLQLYLLIQGGAWDLNLIGGCVALLVVCYQLLFLRTSVDRSIKKSVQQQYNRGELEQQLGEHRLELTASELIVTTNHNTRVFGWSGVEKIVTTPEHAFFYDSEDSAETCFCLGRGVHQVRGNGEGLSGNSAPLRGRPSSIRNPSRR